MERIAGSAQPSPMRIDYAALSLFLAITITAAVAVPVYGYYVGYTWVDWTLCAVLYLASGLGITVGYHRLIAHRSFECQQWIKVALLITGGWALENSAYKWCADHVRHHARCDQAEDPYNATLGFWHSHVLWVFYKDPAQHHEKYAAQFQRDPLVMWQHRYYIPVVLSGMALPFAVGYGVGGWKGGLGCFLLAGLGRMFLVLNSTFCINSICHLWGKQPHTTEDSSRDNWVVSLITFGEGYHNYHHAHQRDYRNGPWWYNIDPSKWLIYGLSKIGVAWNLCRVQPERTRFAAE
ncbi:MAG TPA: acyl-CoA desaturase [Nitrospirales bacterium]|nr:acyl-CoA desaturase [Nitrospirales bacterium]